MIGVLIELLKRRRGLTLLTSAIFVLPISTSACELNWDSPRSHFDNVSFQGYVFLVEDLGKIDAGSGLTLPLRAIFRSESNASSPYAGHGWDIPILESHFVQLDERWFRMVEPTGWNRLFWRDEKNPHILHGQNGWKGEIKGNQISTWSDCGSRISFNKGRISSMRLSSRQFDYVYQEGHVKSIKERGRAILEVETNGPGKGLSVFRTLSSKLAEVELTERPIVQVVNRQRLIERMERSLGRVSYPDGSQRSFQYSADKNVNPTIEGENSLISWDVASRRIIKDSAWSYDVNPGVGLFDCASIRRENSKDGRRESWFFDAKEGQEVSEHAEGIKVLKTWFTQGPMRGRMRSEIHWKNGKEIYRNMFSYDELGRLIRETVDGSPIFMASYDGDRLTEIMKNGITTKYRYSAGVITRVESQLPKNVSLNRQFDKEGRLIGISITHDKMH